MTDMARIYLAWVDDLYTAFDPALHAKVFEFGAEEEIEQQKSIKASQEENAAAVAEGTIAVGRPFPGMSTERLELIAKVVVLVLIAAITIAAIAYYWQWWHRPWV